MLFAMRHNLPWLSFALAPFAAALLVRLFMIQHDCGHGAFLPGKAANDWLGRAIGVLTLTPYDYWRRSHAIHHATSGNLDRRGNRRDQGDDGARISPLNWRRRFLYRLYRHPLVLFGIGPSFTFLIESRLPSGSTNTGAMPWISTMSTNAGAAVAAALLIWWAGLVPFLAVHLPIVVIAATAGVWLFYVQHQYETTSWDRDADWSQADGALAGSSHYDLPPPLNWLSANIGIHHVHHLVERHPVLSAARGAARQPRTARHGTAHALAQFWLHPAGALGRGQAPAGVVSRRPRRAAVGGARRLTLAGRSVPGDQGRSANGGTSTSVPIRRSSA